MRVERFQRNAGTAWGALFVSTIILASASVSAASSTVQDIANFKGTDRQALLEAGAKKEGDLQVYITGAQLDPLLKAFVEKYPYVHVTPFRAESQNIARRIVEEYKVGRYAVDTIETNTGALQPLRDADILQPFVSSESPGFRAQAIEPAKLWIVDKESYVGLGYNTKVYADKDLPKTYDDLLDPKWKGKFSLSSDGGTLELWIGSIVLTKGEDFLRKLGKQDFKIYSIAGRGLSNLVVSGEAPISPSIYSGHMAASKAAGASVDWRALGPIYANLAGVALAKNAPHPHAGMMLIDFLLSRNGQTIYQKLGYASARNDLENWEKPESVLYLTERPNFHEEFEQWNKLIKPVFGTTK
jgi:iron(III) transport system substrate-binding protein